MFFRAFGVTDIGTVRSRNEDAFLIDRANGLFAVADGLGGLPGGAEASTLAVAKLAEVMRRQDLPGIAEMERILHDINAAVAQRGQAIDPIVGIGTTLTLLQLVQRSFILGHVGDSAAYLLRRGKLQKLTTDHTMEQQLIRAIGPSARNTMPIDYPHTLTSCIGQERLTPYCERHELEQGDRLLLCTDGLSKVVTEPETAEILGMNADAELICRTLVGAVHEARGQDNTTAVVVLTDGPGE